MPKLPATRLPSVPDDLAPPAAAPRARAALRRGGLRVLLIEDDALQLRALLRLLGSEGVAAHHVDSAEAGLAAIATQPPYDVIISDQGLGGRLGGADLARRLRQPLLVCYSGYDDQPPWFDAALCKPAVGALLQLLGARRLSIALVQAPEGGYHGRCHESAARSYGRTPREALHLLADLLPA